MCSDMWLSDDNGQCRHGKAALYFHISQPYLVFDSKCLHIYLFKEITKDLSQLFQVYSLRL